MLQFMGLQGVRHNLAANNNRTLGCMYYLFQFVVLVFSGHVPRNGIAGLYGSFYLIF